MAQLTVKMDPRVKVSLQDLQRQLDIEAKLSSQISQGTEAATQARSIHEQIAKDLNSAGGSLKTSLEDLDRKISNLLEGAKNSASASSQEPALLGTNSDLLTLYKAIDQADAPPTAAQLDAATENLGTIATLLAHWKELKSKDIPTINQQLQTAGLPVLEVGLRPQQQESGGDEE